MEFKGKGGNKREEESKLRAKETKENNKWRRDISKRNGNKIGNSTETRKQKPRR